MRFPYIPQGPGSFIPGPGLQQFRKVSRARSQESEQAHSEQEESGKAGARRDPAAQTKTFPGST